MRNRFLPFAVAAVSALAGAATPAVAGDSGHARWPQFRGPAGAGIGDGARPVPVDFGPDRSVLWKAALPPGHSSPVVWGDRVFVTGVVEPERRLETLCLDRRTGQIRWRRAVIAESLEKVHEASSPAAATPVTDGESVYVYFGSYGLVAYDLDGRERWTRPLPLPTLHMGSGASPLLAGERLLLDLPLGKESYLLAVRTLDGGTAWTVPKPAVNGGWSTPMSWQEGGQTLVGVLNPGRFSAHDPADGSERWFVGDLPRQTCSTPVAADGRLYLSISGVQGEIDNVTLPPSFDEMLRHDANQDGTVGTEEIPETLLVTDRRATNGTGNMSLRTVLLRYFTNGKPKDYDRSGWAEVTKGLTDFVKGPAMQSRVLAVRTGGTGDVTASHVEWSESRGVPEVPSPLVYRGRVYLVKNGGIVLCRDAKTGAKVFEGRLGAPGGYYASPVAVNGRVYVASDAGVVTVLESGDTLQVLARNDLGEPIYATPAVVDGTLLVRTTSHLYAFGAEDAPVKH